MALLGYQWDKSAVQTMAYNTGGANIGGIYVNVAHSLGTTPDVVLPRLRSVQALAELDLAGPLTIDGNASQSTVGIVCASVASFPVIAFDAVSIYVWNPVR